MERSILISAEFFVAGERPVVTELGWGTIRGSSSHEIHTMALSLNGRVDHIPIDVFEDVRTAGHAGGRIYQPDDALHSLEQLCDTGVEIYLWDSAESYAIQDLMYRYGYGFCLPYYRVHCASTLLRSAGVDADIYSGPMQERITRRLVALQRVDGDGREALAA